MAKRESVAEHQVKEVEQFSEDAARRFVDSMAQHTDLDGFSIEGPGIDPVKVDLKEYRLREIDLRAPPTEAFMGGDFLDAPEVERLAERLIGRYGELRHLDGWKIRCLWKARGGVSKGRATLGKCVVVPALVRHFTEADFLIWLAADHGRGMTGRQLEALLYHELSHAQVREPEEEDEQPRPFVVGHDAEVFVAEFERYGLWQAGIRPLAQELARQLRMEMDGSGSSPSSDAAKSERR
jgi:hypothetical protein